MNPSAEPVDEYEYAGFWIRVWAALIDTVLIVLLTTPLLVYFYGTAEIVAVRGPETFRPIEFLISWVLPAIAVIAFWRYRSATPGKLAIGARIVDAKTGKPPSLGQLIGRYLSYFISAAPLLLGLLWVAFDRRKQGWHDKLASTVVIRRKRGNTEPVRFGSPEAAPKA